MAPSLAHPVSYGQVIEYIQGTSQHIDINASCADTKQIDYTSHHTLMRPTRTHPFPTLHKQSARLIRSHLERKPGQSLLTIDHHQSTLLSTIHCCTTPSTRILVHYILGICTDSPSHFMRYWAIQPTMTELLCFGAGPIRGVEPTLPAWLHAIWY